MTVSPSKRKPEKTQKKNRHQLTRNQHVLPEKIIERFADTDGHVAVFFKEGRRRGEFVRLPYKEKGLFCAKRVWNQGSEDTTKTTYEDPFQELAKRIIVGTTQVLDSKDNITATCFWGLWTSRFQARKNPPQDKPVFGVSGIEDQDLRERIERAGGMFINPDRTIPGRVIAGWNIQKITDQTLMQNPNLAWWIVEAQELEFIVPDNPGGIPYLPVSPKIALLALLTQTRGKAYFSKKAVTLLNQDLFHAADTYVFANSMPGTTLWT